MSAAKHHKCVVCGRPFPHGQGIVMNIAGIVLEFHSNKCFAKFAKTLLERVPQDEIRGYLKRVLSEYEEVLSQKAKLRMKKI